MRHAETLSDTSVFHRTSFDTRCATIFRAHCIFKGISKYTENPPYRVTEIPSRVGRRASWGFLGTMLAKLSAARIGEEPMENAAGNTMENPGVDRNRRRDGTV